jgi:hypothetical protein
VRHDSDPAGPGARVGDSLGPARSARVLEGGACFGEVAHPALRPGRC